MSVRAVTHVSESAGRGGADISMRRLAAAQRAAGLDTRRLVAEGREEPGLARVAPKRLIDRLPFHALNLAGLNFAGLTGRGRVLDHPFVSAADVVHLHTLHGGWFNYRWLPELGRRKPLVWTLHDQWSLTGHCAYSFDCARWRTGCGACPYPQTYPAVRRDATATEWRWKSAAITAARPHLICPSRWLLDLAAAHPVLSALPRHHIPYGLDTRTFRPHDRESARAELGLPHDRVLALFAAQSLDNPFKNARLLADALRGLPSPARDRLALVSMGRGDALDLGGMPVFHQGYVESEERKALLFSAADFFAFPTRADNLPLVIQEALSCGCPVVTVPVGGVPEMVRHGVTGRVAADLSVAAFQQELVWMIEHAEPAAAMRPAARAHAVKEWDNARQAARVAEVYARAVRDFPAKP